MLDSDAFPDLVFLDGQGRETRLRAGAATGRIRAVAAHLAARGGRPGACVGLMQPTGPDLVLNWLACLEAGLRPLVMQYPTRKQSRAYWAESVRDTVAVAEVAAVVADARCVELGLPGLVPATVPQGNLDALPEAGHDAAPLRLRDFAIVRRGGSSATSAPSPPCPADSRRRTRTR